VRTACTKSFGYPISLKASQVHASWPSSRYRSQCGSFQTSCPHPLHWNRNLEFHLFPYLRLMWGWWWCPGWKTCSISLHASLDGFSLQEVRVLIFHRQDFLLFYDRKTTKNSMNLFYFMNRRAVILLTWRPVLVNLVANVTITLCLFVFCVSEMGATTTTSRRHKFMKSGR